MQFQLYGSLKQLEQNDPEALLVLEQDLHQYNEELIKYFYFGIGGKQSGIQLADHLIYTHKFQIMSISDVLNHAAFKIGQLSTPFKFTYPSGKLGKKIQIKGFTNN
jgi:hypothetical protein